MKIHDVMLKKGVGEDTILYNINKNRNDLNYLNYSIMINFFELFIWLKLNKNRII